MSADRDDLLAALADLTAKVAALSGDDTDDKPGWNNAQAAANIRDGIVVNDGPVMAGLRSGQLTPDSPEVKAALAADRRADRKAAARAEVQRRQGRGAAKGTATGEPQTDYERGKAEARRRFGTAA